MRAPLFIGLALAIALSSFAAPSIARADPAAETDARDRSRAAFKKGVAELRARDWVGARASFEDAWALYPHPSILLNLGVARLKTDDPVLAEQAFVRFLSEDFGAPPDELGAARDALAEARKSIGTLRVVVAPETARVAVDGKSAELVKHGSHDIASETRQKIGRHAVAVDAEGFVTEHREVDVGAKGVVEVKLALVPIARDASRAPATAEPTSKRAIAAWSLTALGGVALVTGGVFGLRAKSLADDYETAGNERFQDPHTRSVGIGFRTAADVALGVGILSGAAALLLFFTDIGGSPRVVGRASRGALVSW